MLDEGLTRGATLGQVSYLEVYREVIRDLLDPARDNLRVREHKGKTWADGASVVCPTPLARGRSAPWCCAPRTLKRWAEKNAARTTAASGLKSRREAAPAQKQTLGLESFSALLLPQAFCCNIEELLDCVALGDSSCRGPPFRPRHSSLVSSSSLSKRDTLRRWRSSPVGA